MQYLQPILHLSCQAIDKFSSYYELIKCSRPIRFFIVSLMYNNILCFSSRVINQSLNLSSLLQFSLRVYPFHRKKYTKHYFIDSVLEARTNVTKKKGRIPIKDRPCLPRYSSHKKNSLLWSAQPDWDQDLFSLLFLNNIPRRNEKRLRKTKYMRTVKIGPD